MKRNIRGIEGEVTVPEEFGDLEMWYNQFTGKIMVRVDGTVRDLMTMMLPKKKQGKSPKQSQVRGVTWVGGRPGSKKWRARRKGIPEKRFETEQEAAQYIARMTREEDPPPNE